MAMVGSPSLSGNALEFYTTYTYYGGELYYVSFGNDTTSSNFVYDGWVYLDNSSGSIANLEMDMNQVMPNGETVIFGFQCDGWNGTWDYTENAGTPTAYVDHWVNSSAACNAQTGLRTPGITSRSAIRAMTTAMSPINRCGSMETNSRSTPQCLPHLLWAGRRRFSPTFRWTASSPGASSSTVYLDNLTISRW